MTDVTYELDLSAHAGILLGAFMTGRSFQPNLLSRATKDQAILSGVAAATGYGWGTSAHSLLRSVARRFGRSGPGASIAVDGLAAAACLTAVKALPAHEHERPGRAFVRLAAMGYGSAGLAGTRRRRRPLRPRSTPGCDDRQRRSDGRPRVRHDPQLRGGIHGCHRRPGA